jgi:signal transduction histidine kinase
MKRFQDEVIARGAGSGMQKRQTGEMLDRPFDQSNVKTSMAQGWGTDPTSVDEIRAITLCQNSERLLEASTVGWLCASILHDLRNPLGTICAGAELLIDLDSIPTQVQRLAGNMARAAGRMRQLLAELASLARDNVSTATARAPSSD